MGLLDDIFGKEEISRLKYSLDVQVSAFGELQTELSKKIEHASRREIPRSDTTCLAISRRRDGLTTFL
jgi:hypothetical protein